MPQIPQTLQPHSSQRRRWLRLLTTFAGIRGCVALIWGVAFLFPHTLDNPSYLHFRQFGPLFWAALAFAIGLFQLRAVLIQRGGRWATALTATLYMTVAAYIWFSPLFSLLMPTVGVLGLGALVALASEDEP